MPTISQTSALRAQSASPSQVACVLWTNQHADIFELAAFAHGVANRAGADIEAEDKTVEEGIIAGGRLLGVFQNVIFHIHFS